MIRARFLAAVLVLATCAACGQKGPLRLPEPAKKPASGESPASTAPAAPIAPATPVIPAPGGR
jgi:predicted small lipoprotein YifL